MAMFLGVDAGGTQTTAAVGDGPSILGRGCAGSCKLPQVPLELARRELHSAIERACREASVEPRTIEFTCIGMAGFSNREGAEGVRALAEELVGAGKVAVTSDAQIALEAAFRGQPGVVVIAGTGSMALGRNQRGATVRAGGWGPAASDEGSGYWIGRSAVAATLRALDGGRQPGGVMASRVLAFFRAIGPEELAKAVNGASPAEVAQVLPEVIQARREGDTEAADILIEAATHLAALARRVLDRLGLKEQAVRIGMSGGVFKASPELCKAFQLVISSSHSATFVEGVEPVEGALFLASQAAAQGRGQQTG